MVARARDEDLRAQHLEARGVGMTSAASRSERLELRDHALEAVEMVSAVLSVGLAGWTERLTGNKSPGEGGGQLGRAFGSSFVWIAYFLQSTRVKATFVVP